MRSRSATVLSLSAAVTATAILFAAASTGAEVPERLDVASQMRDAAQAYLGELTPAERDQGTWDFDSPERVDWHFIPRERYGVRLADMTDPQRDAAQSLLRSVLSSQGYLKATGVLRLEGILGEIEGRPEFRDPGDYYLNIFGTPSEEGPWGWRFEGHHVSLNFTTAGDGRPSVTPAFFGSNPAIVLSGADTGWKLLGAEEDLARELLGLLDDFQLRTAIVEQEAPDDIITGNARNASLGSFQGIRVSTLTEEQQVAFIRLLGEYLRNVNPEVAQAELEEIEESGFENLYFAWAGSTDVGEGHYYRIHGPTVLIEYDNVQGGANHVHSVWRDPQDDFGDDLLRRHYEEAAHHSTNRPAAGASPTGS